MVLTPAQEFVYLRTYSRWLPEQRRREVYQETVKRYIEFMKSELGSVIAPVHANAASNAILSMSVMPSMRALWSAGPAAKDSNIAMYNCAYSAVTSLRSFADALFILMCGTGYGFSVERQFVDQLPYLQPLVSGREPVRVVVEDSKYGWADALYCVLEALWAGYDIDVDYSKIRPRGARLATMGGRASGPGPLRDLFDFIKKKIEEKRAKKQYRLQPIDCLDIMNKIAEIVVVGGVRRSSEICLSDLEDRAIAEAKMGEFWNEHPHRAMSNNSAVYLGRPDVMTFMEEFMTLIKSRAGERGIFNREGALKQMVASGRRVPWASVGVNPCAEILLRDKQFCNLSEAVVRSDDTLDTLRKKVKIAAMLGVWQSTFTDFPFIDSQWGENCREERLLGVSLTGIMDHPVLNNVNDTMKKWLADLKGAAIGEAHKWCHRLGINMSAAITAIKPSGTVSQLVNCASGIHQRYANYYIRRYRISATDPLFRLMKDQGVPYCPEVGQEENTASTMVLDFPIAAPAQCCTRHDFTAIKQLEHWKVVKNFWCEHNPSVTVYVGDDEWLQTASWVYDNFDDICGVAFLPKTNHTYNLAPYEEIGRDRYEELAAAFPKIDYSVLGEYEEDDNTTGAKSYACVGDKCEL